MSVCSVDTCCDPGLGTLLSSAEKTPNRYWNHRSLISSPHCRVLWSVLWSFFPHQGSLMDRLHWRHLLAKPSAATVTLAAWQCLPRSPWAARQVIETTLSVSRRPRWPRQVQWWLSRATVVSIIAGVRNFANVNTALRLIYKSNFRARFCNKLVHLGIIIKILFVL